MRSGEEIRQALVGFATRWRGYGGSERAEAQTFLNELFACYGRDRRDAGAKFEDAHSSAGIMDLHLPGVAIIEMKAPGEAGRLDRHREQALNYWRYSADVATERPAPDYVVLCAFHRFEIWEPGHYPTEPRLRFTLDDLPDRYEALQFLAGPHEEPLFHQTSRAVTAEAATALAAVYQDLLARDAANPPVVRNFLLVTNVFAFDDDYSMGVLSSFAHGAWAWSRSSTLKGDLRYTPTSVFATFPWPDPVTEQRREAVAEASRRVITRRQAICTAEQFGLTRLYNLVDEGAYSDLKALHRDLDEAVARCYGWPKPVAQDADEIVRRLLQLNREISAGERPYDPFGTRAGTLEQPELVGG